MIRNNFVSTTDEGITCPRNLGKILFIVATIDDVDQDPSSVTAKFLFHGTITSMYQKNK